jgi:hypothetical protein
MRDSIAPIGAAVNAFFRALRHDGCFPRDKHKDDTSHDLGAPCDGRCDVRPRLQQPDELLAKNTAVSAETPDLVPSPLTPSISRTLTRLRYL